MSTIPSMPGASPSRPSRPRPRPLVAIPTKPRAEEEDPEIAALTKKISVLREKRAREEEERRRREEEEKKAREAAEKVRREELEWAKAVKEEGEVVAESGPKKPKDILQASPGTPPST